MLKTLYYSANLKKIQSLTYCNWCRLQQLMGNGLSLKSVIVSGNIVYKKYYSV